MTAPNGRRVVVNIGEVIIDAADGADLGALEAEVRAGIAAAFVAGAGGAPPPAFARSAPLLETAHAGVPGIGAAIAAAVPPGRSS